MVRRMNIRGGEQKLRDCRLIKDLDFLLHLDALKWNWCKRWMPQSLMPEEKRFHLDVI
ncbi:Uncharacterised protein [uncultured archaeon]|nr:Uncharacterised protein [uncultured archaeon]